ncbi:hypothetical protein FC52_GL000969 [Lactobacillus pasteurii DSM 23907 = CRBIP 24.76]|uniref:Uncharacterized protein n=1 Tax=Lactobacillus pasteurii DSM 23907 = CRBIP 24.76 TaxID=1423790 RepID=I7IZ55_9LACO|nr:hypothetical protein [Lactobacillus pasteurii]KRK08233.1 hypothetical protein FC52_GL000969 [Lactobacillus pasteurii DSM 23907 = CRBIP 24.76]TDG77352.1 hypothetical protein C5L33_000795 [Lactobacillus pasteurii]CCI84897.1 Protein of unknown function [Lactobacillus pasteurii DSM 23907 = CRBIP 24.76]
MKRKNVISMLAVGVLTGVMLVQGPKVKASSDSELSKEELVALFEKRISTMQSARSNLKALPEMLTDQQLSEVEDRIDQLDQILKLKERKLELLLDEIEKTELETQHLREIIAELDGKLDAYKDQLADLEDSLPDEKEKKDDLTDIVKDAISDKAEKKEIKQAAIEIRSVLDQDDDKRALKIVNRAVYVNKKADNLFKDAKPLAASIDDNNQAKNDELAALKAKIKQIQDDRQKLTGHLETLNTQLEQALKKYAESRKELDELTVQKSKLQDKAKELKAKKQTLDDQKTRQIEKEKKMQDLLNLFEKLKMYNQNDSSIKSGLISVLVSKKPDVRTNEGSYQIYQFGGWKKVSTSYLRKNIKGQITASGVVKFVKKAYVYDAKGKRKKQMIKTGSFKQLNGLKKTNNQVWALVDNTNWVKVQNIKPL